jgi:hypothetical protein
MDFSIEKRSNCAPTIHIQAAMILAYRTFFTDALEDLCKIAVERSNRRMRELIVGNEA